MSTAPGANAQRSRQVTFTPKLNSEHLIPTVITSKTWHSDIEPIVADWAQTAGSRLRRQRAKMGPWILEFVSQNDTTCRLFGEHWTPANMSDPPNAYCYHLGESVSHSAHASTRTTCSQPIGSLLGCVVCPENGRALVYDPISYTDVNQICDLLITAVAARNLAITKSTGRRRPVEAWWVLRATSVEYQTESGDTHSVALLNGPELQRTIHGFALADCKPENGLLSDGVTCARIDSGTGFRTKARLWWPATLVAVFRHLLPHVVKNPSEGLALDASLADYLAGYRNALDLARALEAGSFPQERYELLACLLASAHEGHSLIDPRELLGADRYLEQSQLTDLICCICDLASDVILRTLPRNGFLIESTRDLEAISGPFGDAIVRAQQANCAQLIDTFRLRSALLNTRLPIAQTQFCLRHFLEGLSDSVRLLAPNSFFDSSILDSMRLQKRVAEQSNDGPTICFAHGTRRVHLLAFERQGQRMELVAFDPAVEGYAQVRAVWPGQVADFFSRHAGLRARELFTGIKR